MLIDKGYYDYDFEAVKTINIVDNTAKSKEEVVSLMQKFGFCKMTPDELQKDAMKECKT